MFSINKSSEQKERGDTGLCLFMLIISSRLDNDVSLSIIFSKVFFLNKIIIRQNVLRPVAKPVDNVEDEEQKRHRDQEESVSVDMIRATAILLWLLQVCSIFSKELKY